ncbi:hypothetical protein RJ639_008105, partial [Escallonia herrerae]
MEDPSMKGIEGTTLDLASNRHGNLVSASSDENLKDIFHHIRTSKKPIPPIPIRHSGVARAEIVETGELGKDDVDSEDRADEGDDSFIVQASSLGLNHIHTCSAPLRFSSNLRDKARDGSARSKVSIRHQPPAIASVEGAMFAARSSLRFQLSSKFPKLSFIYADIDAVQIQLSISDTLLHFIFIEMGKGLMRCLALEKSCCTIVYGCTPEDLKDCSRMALLVHLGQCDLAGLLLQAEESLPGPKVTPLRPFRTVLVDYKWM